MQCTSTGLGKRKLQLNVVSAERAEDTILVQAKSYEPVIWDIRVIVEKRDIPSLMKLVLSRPVLAFVVGSLWSFARSRLWSRK